MKIILDKLLEHYNREDGIKQESFFGLLTEEQMARLDGMEQYLLAFIESEEYRKLPDDYQPDIKIEDAITAITMLLDYCFEKKNATNH
ncbi:MAG: hypothetical protein KME30_19030 [Iphinoe sp. HA4291-MV1]|nr:hypothetical protein [Iphinoe sp. HA4291-MV1]